MKPETLLVDPEPRFDLSPNLTMQFMEPLGTTDGSVEAAWDHLRDDWREDVVEVTRELAPPLMRWGGCFSSFYRWREGVGPRSRRRPMHNLCWGGIETNQIGTHEFVGFCRRVGATPFYCVNFESDGRQRWARPPKGGKRSAGPAEAAAWVDYCNNPNNALRRGNGAREPFSLKLWQIGNETSYDKRGYDCETAGRRTIAFARAMRKVDPDLELIGWGDSGWAPRVLEICGAHIQYIAFHQGPKADDSLHGYRWREDPAQTWAHLMQAYVPLERKIRVMREQVAGSHVKLALTEGHFSLRARNRGDLLSSWAAGVANARCLNVFQRNGDLLKIATLADFCGTRWQCNAIMIPTPRGQAYMMPVARVMGLYRKHSGRQAASVRRAPNALDVVASRTGSRVFLNVVNTSRTRAVPVVLKIDGRRITAGKAFEIADDPMAEIDRFCPDRFAPVEKRVPASGKWTFPPASVTAVELNEK
ncbi:MAG: alpha-L-arabinofuranosidase [Kiritimatiellae bacterium]|nr:alpha-L-arabinofuranosidase [Kiritimatiellia bacterium]